VAAVYKATLYVSVGAFDPSTKRFAVWLNRETVTATTMRGLYS
jgi:hypothetical protein